MSAPLHSSQAGVKTLPGHVCCSFPSHHGLKLHGCSTCVVVMRTLELWLSPPRVVFERLICSKQMHVRRRSSWDFRARCVYTLRHWVMIFGIALISCLSESRQQQENCCDNSLFDPTGFKFYIQWLRYLHTQYIFSLSVHNIENYNRRLLWRTLSIVLWGLQFFQPHHPWSSHRRLQPHSKVEQRSTTTGPLGAIPTSGEENQSRVARKRGEGET